MQQLVSLEHALAVIGMRIMSASLNNDVSAERQMLLKQVMQSLKTAWPTEMEAARLGTDFAALPEGGVQAVWVGD